MCACAPFFALELRFARGAGEILPRTTWRNTSCVVVDKNGVSFCVFSMKTTFSQPTKQKRRATATARGDERRFFIASILRHGNSANPACPSHRAGHIRNSYCPTTIRHDVGRHCWAPGQGYLLACIFHQHDRSVKWRAISRFCGSRAKITRIFLKRPTMLFGYDATIPAHLSESSP